MAGTIFHDALAAAEVVCCYLPALFGAQRKIAAWRKEYNEERPRSSLGYRTPHEFAQLSRGKDGDTPALENASAFASGVSHFSEGGQNIRNYTVGGVEVGLGNEFSNLVKIEGGLRVEIVTGHLPRLVARLEPGWERRAALFSRKRAKTSSPGTGFTLPLFKSS